MQLVNKTRQSRLELVIEVTLAPGPPRARAMCSSVRGTLLGTAPRCVACVSRMRASRACVSSTDHTAGPPRGSAGEMALGRKIIVFVVTYCTI